MTGGQFSTDVAVRMAMKFYKPDDPRGAINRFLYDMAPGKPGAMKPLFFVLHKKFSTELKAASKFGSKTLEEAMRKVGHTIERRSHV